MSGMLVQGSAPGAAPTPPPAQERKLRDAAQKFEAMTISALLQPMFETVKTPGVFGGGAGEEQWKPMMVDEIGKAIAKGGGLGLADPIYRAMLQAQEAQK